MLEYKGYTGKVDLDGEAGIFHGEVLDLRDVITFEGRSVDTATSTSALRPRARA
jgi:predicted HicB family RNase H-like nuclease